jgi:hypothetical protein
MAWIAVRTDRGEEIASFEVTDDAAYLEMERVAPGLGNAVMHALECEAEREH